jgi:hypothetical protein
MPDRLLIARWFLSLGGFLLVAGLGLWFFLPIPGIFPPYVVTGLLAVVYGTYCWLRSPVRPGSS